MTLPVKNAFEQVVHIDKGGDGSEGDPYTDKNAAIGSTDDSLLTDSSSSGSLVSFLKGLVSWAFGRMPASLGQKTKAESFPVTLASDTGTLSVTGVVTGDISGSLVLIANPNNNAVYVQPGAGVYFPISDNGGSLTVDAPPNAPVYVRLSTGSSAIDSLVIYDTPTTSGGLSTYSFLSTAAVQSANLKASAGQVYSMQFFNLNASPRYVRLYDKASTSSGSDTPLWRGIIPGNTVGAGFVVSFDKGLACTLGISIRVTAAVADNDTTILGANEIIGNVQYK